MGDSTGLMIAAALGVGAYFFLGVGSNSGGSSTNDPPKTDKGTRVKWTQSQLDQLYSGYRERFDQICQHVGSSSAVDNNYEIKPSPSDNGYDMTFRCGDGSIIHYDVNQNRLIDTENKNVQFIRDPPERAQIEKQYGLRHTQYEAANALFSNLPNGFNFIDPTGQVAPVSEMCAGKGLECLQKWRSDWDASISQRGHAGHEEQKQQDQQAREEIINNQQKGNEIDPKYTRLAEKACREEWPKDPNARLTSLTYDPQYQQAWKFDCSDGKHYMADSDFRRINLVAQKASDWDLYQMLGNPGSFS